MAKQNSIRSAVNGKFIAMLPQLATLGGRNFRHEVLKWAHETLGITWAAACTHYNFAFQRIKQSEPELVVGLGRPEGKNNGGRKKKTSAVTIVTPAAPLLLTYTAAPASTSLAGAMAGLEHLFAEEQVEQQAPDLSVLLQAPMLPLLPEVAVEPQLFTVVRCKDGAEVGTGLTKEEAEAMVAKAAAAKKAKLQIK